MDQQNNNNNNNNTYTKPKKMTSKDNNYNNINLNPRPKKKANKDENNMIKRHYRSPLKSKPLPKRSQHQATFLLAK